MLQSQILAHFQEQADRLVSGQLDGMGAMFALPLPIHFPSGMTIVLDPDAGQGILRQMSQELQKRGTVAARPEITAVELPKQGRFRVWIDWKETNAAGVEVTGSSILYFCRKVPTGLQTEMIQYLHVLAPGMVTDETRIARSA
ncbi:MAG TPA: hypothetical protein PKA03_04865 [Tabrizicola sp.]|nr:hypothetical protein [Tabrizicola sp.]